MATPLAITHRPRVVRPRNGSTLVELAVATSIITIFILGSYFAITRVNRYANISRLQTLAYAVAQHRIDEILTAPWGVGGSRAGTVLADGAPQPLETNIPLNDDVINDGAGLSSAYTGLDVSVLATRTTSIAVCAWATPGTSTIRADVTVTYTYRNRNYSVSLFTLRTPDSI